MAEPFNPAKMRNRNPAAQRMYAAGVAEGKREAYEVIRAELLNELDRMYMDPKVVRGSTEGKAILDITAHLSTFMKSKS